MSSDYDEFVDRMWCRLSGELTGSRGKHTQADELSVQADRYEDRLDPAVLSVLLGACYGNTREAWLDFGTKAFFAGLFDSPTRVIRLAAILFSEGRVALDAVIGTLVPLVGSDLGGSLEYEDVVQLAHLIQEEYDEGFASTREDEHLEVLLRTIAGKEGKDRGSR